MPLAGLAGALSAGFLLENLGRKKTFWLTAAPFVFAGLLTAFAVDVNMIYAGRSITGFFIGIIGPAIPVYLSETVHPEVRGTLCVLPAMMGNLGLLVAYMLGIWLDWFGLSIAGAVRITKNLNNCTVYRLYLIS